MNTVNDIQRKLLDIRQCRFDTDRLAKVTLLAEQVKALLKEKDIASKKLVSLLAELRLAEKALNGLSISWISIGKGYLALGPRPKEKMIAQMSWLGVTHIVTLQSLTERAKKIGQLARDNDIEWFWFPMESAKPPSQTRHEELKSIFRKMCNALQEGAGFYIHCAAGIHRTGMIAYAFLRYFGLAEEQANITLNSLRQETALGVGHERKQWADEFLGL